MEQINAFLKKASTLLWEWLLTFSNKSSLLSSKRLERFVGFMVVIIAFAAYMFKGIFSCNITSTDLVMVGGTILGYSGFNTIQARKEKKDETGQNNT